MPPDAWLLDTVLTVMAAFVVVASYAILRLFQRVRELSNRVYNLEEAPYADAEWINDAVGSQVDK